MATSRFTSYGSAADAFQQSDLTGLANGAGKLSTATPVDNSSNRHFYLDLFFRMTLSSGSFSPGAGAHLAFYLLPRMDDDTSYPDAADSATAAQQAPITAFIGAMAARTAASQTQLLLPPLRGIIIPPGVFKFYVINRLGANLPSNNVTIACRYRTYSEETV